MNVKLLFFVLVLLALISSVRASQNRGVVYDLKDYREEIGIANPWDCFNSNPNGCTGKVYNESAVSPNPSANNYALALASFVKKKCAAGCRHVLIVGDDFVVPSVREFGASFTEDYPRFSDRAFVPSTLKSVGDVNGFFNKGEVVAFVLPDNITPEIRVAVDSLKQTIKQKYGLQDNYLEEINGNDNGLDCGSYPFHPLAGKTLVIVGVKENNRLISCFGASALGGGRETYSVQPNSWGDFGPFRKYALIINSESQQVVDIVSYLIKNDLIRSRNYSQLEFFNDQIKTCDVAGWLPVVDWVAESCAVGLSCFVIGNPELAELEDNDAGFWCSTGGAFVVLAPSVAGKGLKWAARYGDDLLVAAARTKVGDKYVEEIFEAFIARFGASGEAIAAKYSRGIGKSAVNPKLISIEKFEEVEAAYKSINIDDFFTGGGEEQLELLIKNTTHGGTKIGNESVEGVTRLTKGRVGSDGFGWDHLKEKHITGDASGGSTFSNEYGITDEGTIRGWINDSIQNPSKPPYQPHPDTEPYKWAYEYAPMEGKSNMVVIIDKRFGTVTTAYPLS